MRALCAGATASEFWRWYRQDGTPSRSGRFAHGDPVGTWETWDRDGNLVRRTER